MTSHIHRYVEDARRLSSVHPESALSMARKAAEAVCKEVHEQKIGAVGPRALLEDLLQKLSQHSAIPRKIQVPLRTIQAYGNHASHDQGESMPIDCRYIQPALQALDTVMLWFLEEFANGEGKAEVPEATPRVPEVERFAPASGDLSGPVVAAQTVAIHGCPVPPISPSPIPPRSTGRTTGIRPPGVSRRPTQVSASGSPADQNGMSSSSVSSYSRVMS